ncbi:MAG: NfeD family protein [Clostridia bacterium]|nr:NfeD family protein [Clostridia bacterium]
MGEFFAEYGLALLWIAVTAVAVVVETQTCDLESIWFVPGAVVALILALIPLSFWVQLVVFMALSAVSLILFNLFFKKRLRPKTEEKTNVDALIGAHGIVEEEINNLYEKGSVKVRGLVWTARSANDTVTIPAGSLVTIVNVSGVKLICELPSAE